MLDFLRSLDPIDWLVLAMNGVSLALWCATMRLNVLTRRLQRKWEG